MPLTKFRQGVFYMKNLQMIKTVGEQMLALSIELLRLFDTDEQERAALIESVKKTVAERC